MGRCVGQRTTAKTVMSDTICISVQILHRNWNASYLLNHECYLLMTGQNIVLVEVN